MRTSSQNSIDGTSDGDSLIAADADRSQRKRKRKKCKSVKGSENMHVSAASGKEDHVKKQCAEAGAGGNDSRVVRGVSSIEETSRQTASVLRQEKPVNSKKKK